MDRINEDNVVDLAEREALDEEVEAAIACWARVMRDSGRVLDRHPELAYRLRDWVEAEVERLDAAPAGQVLEFRPREARGPRA